MQVNKLFNFLVFYLSKKKNVFIYLNFYDLLAFH